MTAAESAGADRPAKVQGCHLDRWAIVYVRQSHPQQVQRHRESAHVQIQLRQRALQWGWPAERIRVLDGDQGCSGATTAGRDDFAWLLAEIALNHVGLVLGFQINRLAREEEDCCHLIKLCAAFHTLLADQDGLYNPRIFNDRILLNVKGLTGGIELHEIQQRMQASRLSPRRPRRVDGPAAPGLRGRGRLQIAVRSRRAGPAGAPLDLRAVRRLGQPQRPVAPPASPSHRVAVSPGLRAGRGATAMACAVSRDRAANPPLPGLRRSLHLGPTRRRPDAPPAGAARHRPAQARAEECAVFLRDNHPAYISWDQYESNVVRLTHHRRHGPAPGPARTTVALLAGLVRCGRCGGRMQNALHAIAAL